MRNQTGQFFGVICANNLADDMGNVFQCNAAVASWKLAANRVHNTANISLAACSRGGEGDNPLDWAE